MSFWFEFFKDKRFSFRFKVANLIMNDYLRNYLATDCCILNKVINSKDCSDFNKRQINKVVKNINTLMEP